MKYFDRVRSTLKKGCDVRLGPKTVICGPNGSGKSTIVQSLEIAANGWASDMEGRPRVKLPSALARLFPTNDRTVMARLSDGTVYDWELMDGTKPGSLRKPEMNQPMNVVWPVQDLMEVLRGDSQTVASWLEKQVVGDISESDILAALPPSMRPVVSDFLRTSKKKDFIALAKEAAQQAKNLKSQATRSEKTIDSMVTGVAPPMLDAERARLEQQMRAMAEEEGISQSAYDALEAEVMDSAGKLADLLTAMSEAPKPSAEMLAASAKLQGVCELIEHHVDTYEGEDCWVCGVGDYWQVMTQRDRMAAVAKDMGEAVTQHRALAALQREIDTLTETAQAKAAALKAASIKSDNAERQAIMQKLAADAAARRSWANAEAARAEVDQMRGRAELLGVASKALDKAGKKKLEEAKAAFEEKVTAFLPEGESLGVDLSSARLGLMRDGQLHSALSGAEWSRVLLALAAAQDGYGSTPCVLVPEDRAWDSDTLQNVMVALADAPVQVIIMSTVEPKPVEGWTLINT